MSVPASVPASSKRKRLLCRFNLHHKWVRRFEPGRRGLPAVQSLRQRISMTLSATTRTSSAVSARAAAGFDQLSGRSARRERGGLRRAFGGVLEVSTHRGAVSVEHCGAVSVEHRSGPVRRLRSRRS